MQYIHKSQASILFVNNMQAWNLYKPLNYFKIAWAPINGHGPIQEQVFYNTFTVNSTEISKVKIAQLNIYVYTCITVHNPTGMRSFQIYLLHSETRVPSISTTIPSAITKKKKFKVPKLSGTCSRNPNNCPYHYRHIYWLGHPLKINWLQQ